MLAGFFNNDFPYTNINDVNLDWIIEKVADLEQRVAALEGNENEEEET